MARDLFHLGWFLGGYYPQAWNSTWAFTRRHSWMSADRWVDFTRTLEEACFEFMVCEDSSWVPRAFGSAPDFYVETGASVPKQDPGVLSALIAAGTSRIGVVPTLSTGEWLPYPLARMVGTLDQISGGRAGWNVVTGSSDLAVQNLGRDHIAGHDLRYDMADEFLDIVFGLWNSWDADALEFDRERGRFGDPAKVRSLDYEGRFYRCRGPLVSGRPPQGRPVIVQAGGSPRGRAFAAKNADVIIASCYSVEHAKRYRDEVREQAIAFGRSPDEVKVLFVVHPVIAETDELARQRIAGVRQAAYDDPRHVLAGISYITEVDFAGVDVDRPVDEFAATIATTGNQSSLQDYLHLGAGLSIREMAAKVAWSRRIEITGSPDTAAGLMAEVMQEVGGDGFLFLLPDFSRRAVSEITDGLVPVVQRRGLVRSEYTRPHFRDHILEF